MYFQNDNDSFRMLLKKQLKQIYFYYLYILCRNKFNQNIAYFLRLSKCVVLVSENNYFCSKLKCVQYFFLNYCFVYLLQIFNEINCSSMSKWIFWKKVSGNLLKVSG